MLNKLKKWKYKITHSKKKIKYMEMEKEYRDEFSVRFENFLTQYRYAEKNLNISKEWEAIEISKENAIRFAHEYINEEPERYIDNRKQRASYAYRIAHCGENINSRFRNDFPDKDDLKCAKYISQNTNKVPLILYRGIGKEVCRMMYENAREMNGVDLYEKSFLYCSLVKGCEIPSQYHLRIFVPAGTQLFYAGNVNDEQYRYEVDIQAGGRLKIISVDEKYINCRLLDTEQIS